MNQLAPEAKIHIHMKRYMFTALSIYLAVSFLFVVAVCHAARGDALPPPMPNATTAGRLCFQGKDEEMTTKPFRVHDHWRIRCTGLQACQDFGVIIFAVPESGKENLEVINLSAPGTASAAVNNGGTYSLHIIGYGSQFVVTVEDGK